ncbi:hypothetical protein HC891_16870 [Candidatus Gracilibacteria bacterium]|nr:hypothetical protein [Candidatus Gracilibacteria bacterium]
MLAWGVNNYGQLGDGGPISDFSYSSAPVAVTTLTGVAKIAAGGGHSLAVKSDGTLWAWGRYEIASDATASTPVQIAGVTDAQAIEASAFTSLVLRANGTVLAWGINEEGQLGDGTKKIG